MEGEKRRSRLLVRDRERVLAALSEATLTLANREIEAQRIADSTNYTPAVIKRLALEREIWPMTASEINQLQTWKAQIAESKERQSARQSASKDPVGLELVETQNERKDLSPDELKRKELVAELERIGSRGAEYGVLQTPANMASGCANAWSVVIFLFLVLLAFTAVASMLKGCVG